jgi:hypothetical protein
MRKFLFVLAILAASRMALADTVTWASWNTGGTTGSNGVATATIGSVNVTYNGELEFITAANPANFNYFAPPATYVGGSVSNAPPAANGFLGIDGTATTHTLTFSTAVTGVVFSFISLGQPSVHTTYNFNQPFTIEACGSEVVYGGGCPTESGNSLIGSESDGTIEFTSATAFTTLTWTGANPEYWNGFTVGLLPQGTVTGPVPEPETLAMVGTGLIGFAGLLRRRLFH